MEREEDLPLQQKTKYILTILKEIRQNVVRSTNQFKRIIVLSNALVLQGAHSE